MEQCHCCFSSQLIFLKSRHFLSNQSIVLILWLTACLMSTKFKQILRWFWEIFGWSFRLLILTNYLIESLWLACVRWAYGKGIWSPCYFYTHEPLFLRSGTWIRWLFFNKFLVKIWLLFSKTSQFQGNWNNIRWSNIDIKLLKFCFHIFSAF